MVLAMLRQRNSPVPVGMSKTQILQDMSIYVAEIQRGTIVNRGDPIYVLLSKATETIQKLLDSFHSGAVDVNSGGGYTGEDGAEDWAAILGQDLWDFETGFWQSLANHPFLSTFDPEIAGL